MPAWGRSSPLAADVRVISRSRVRLRIRSSLLRLASSRVEDLTWALCAVKTGQTAKFRSAAEGCDGLAGRVPHLAPYLVCMGLCSCVFQMPFK